MPSQNSKHSKTYFPILLVSPTDHLKQPWSTTAKNENNYLPKQYTEGTLIIHSLLLISHLPAFLTTHINIKLLCIYLSLAMLGLCCCPRVFSSCSVQGLLFSLQWFLLLQSCRAWALWYKGSVAVAKGLVAPQHVESSWTKNWNWCLLRWQVDS